MVFVDDPSHPVLTGDDARHLLDVLRLRPGESVVAGAGSWVPCRVAGPTGGRAPGELDAVLVADGELVTATPAVPAVTVAFVPAKGDRPEWVVQKLTELGVDRIVPVTSRRSVVRWDPDRAERAAARLRRVAREAAAHLRWTIRWWRWAPRGAGPMRNWRCQEERWDWVRRCSGPRPPPWWRAPSCAEFGTVWSSPLRNHAP
jgi:16S rRNA (uracil1498-N3)-methyltransferase